MIISIPNLSCVSDNEIKRFYYSSKIEIKQLVCILDSLKHRMKYTNIGIYPNFEKNKDSKIVRLSFDINNNHVGYLFSSKNHLLYIRDSMVYNEYEKKIFHENELFLNELVKLSLKINKDIEESESEIFIAFGPTKKLFNNSWDGICIVKSGNKNYSENSKNQLDTNTFICTSALTH